LPLVGDRVRTNYTFGGWSTSVGGTSVGLTYTPTASATLYAVWTLNQYVITYNGNAANVGNTSATYTAGGSALTLPVVTRASFVFNGWYSSSIGGSLIGLPGATYVPTASGSIYARWTQLSLSGVDASDLSYISSTTANANIGVTSTFTTSNSSASVSVPAGSLPDGTVISYHLLASNANRTVALPAGANYVLSLVVSWVAPDGSVPSTATNKPIAMTVSSASIKKGASVYAIAGSSIQFLGVATQDGWVLVNITDDPEVAIVKTKPSPPINVSGSLTNSTATINWLEPLSSGGSEILGYEVSLSGLQNPCITSALTCSFTGLTAGTTYTVTVRAFNAIGYSDAGITAGNVPITLTVPAPPAPPTPVAPPAQLVVAKTVKVVNPTLTSLTFVENSTKNGGRLIWTGTNIESVLFTGLSSTYPAPYNYGAFTISWDGTLVNMRPGVTYKMKLEVRSATGGSESRTIEYEIQKLPPQIQSIEVSKLQDMQFGLAAQKFTAAASSGLSVSVIVSTPTVCAVINGAISAIAAGTCSLAFEQIGNENFLAAPSITRTFTISSAKTAVAMNPVLDEVTELQSRSVTLNLIVDWSETPFTVEFCVIKVENSATCIASAKQVISNINGAKQLANGKFLITQQMTGLSPETTYFAAATVVTSVESSKAAQRSFKTAAGLTLFINGDTEISFGESFNVSLQILPNLSSVKSWTAAGLPAGVKITQNSKDLLIAGTPSALGAYFISMEIKDAEGFTTKKNFTLMVKQKNAPSPVIIGAYFQPTTAKSTTVAWQLVSSSTGVEVRLNNVPVCVTTSNKCVIKDLLGPKAKLTVVARDSANKFVDPVIPSYVSPVKLIEIQATYFAISSNKLTAAQKTKIAAVAAEMLAKGFTRVTIYGYADSTGSKSLNQKLSLARATSVLDYLKLTLKNLPVTAKLIGKGATDRFATDGSAKSQAANRRSVIAIG
jgi:uncharacterized repeat protein (TIGR02543 family)